MFDWFMQNQEAATLLFTGVVALSTFVYATLTAVLVTETNRMRRAQSDPKIAAFFEPIEEFVNFGHLYIENIGMGPAYDITFELEPDGNRSGAEYLISDFSATKFLERGVKFLGPGQKLRSGYTSFSDHLDQKIEAVICVTIRYRSATGRRSKEKYWIDFGELEGFGKLGKPHLYSIAQSMEKLQRDIGHLVSGFKTLKVDLYDRVDREEKQTQRDAQRRHGKNSADCSGEE